MPLQYGPFQRRERGREGERERGRERRDVEARIAKMLRTMSPTGTRALHTMYDIILPASSRVSPIGIRTPYAVSVTGIRTPDALSPFLTDVQSNKATGRTSAGTVIMHRTGIAYGVCDVMRWAVLGQRMAWSAIVLRCAVLGWRVVPALRCDTRHSNSTSNLRCGAIQSLIRQPTPHVLRGC
eukprot:3778984-Rhodomonas_salina.2